MGGKVVVESLLVDGLPEAGEVVVELLLVDG